MESKQVLLQANQQCGMLVFPLLEDLSTAALVSPMPNAGNHAHWVLGHLTLSEGQFRTMMQGTPNPYEPLKSSFGGGSSPKPNGEGYPAYNELLDKLKASHQAMLGWIDNMTEDDLDQPCKVIPPGFEHIFGTWRQALLVRAMHWMNHRGQLADCRRAAGRPPLMM